MIWILIAHPQHYLSIVFFKVFQVCRFHAAKSQTQNLCWRCNIFLKAISCWSNGDYQVFIRCDEYQQNTGLVINYFKPSNLQYFIQNCGSLWMHICLSVCLLPTWTHVWAFLQSLLLNFFVVEILSQVFIFFCMFFFYFTKKESYRKSHKFRASVDWYLIHSHSLSKLGISSKLSNACRRAYKCV